METTLIRTPLVSPVGSLSLDDALRGLAKQVKLVLGYTHLDNEIGSIAANKSTTTKVAEAFAKLEIEPFSRQSVEDYKSYQEHKENKPYRAWLRQDHGGFIFASIVAFVGTGLWTVLVGRNIYLGAHHSPPDLSWGWTALLAIPLAAWAYHFLYTIGISNNTSFQWNMTYLKHYSKPVPEFVLARALAIKQELPTAEFLVDGLEGRAETRDPFLVVQIDNTRYYVDVWEEPKFEGRRTV